MAETREKKPFLWLGSQESWERNWDKTQEMMQNRTGVFGAVDTTLEAGAAAASVVAGAASFTVWINQHWRLAIVGLVALVILLKD